MSKCHDVIVVGGGVLGSAVAFELTLRDIDVLLIDCTLPGKATSASAGGLWPVGEAVGLGCGVILHATQESDSTTVTPPNALPDFFRDFLVSSRDRFPKLSVELVERTGIDIELSSGYGLLFLMYGEQERNVVEHIRRSLPGDMEVTTLSPQEVKALEPKISNRIIGGALIQGEHQVNPMLLSEAYKSAALKNGAGMLANTKVTGLRRVKDKVVGVEIGDDFIPGNITVNAAGAWSGALARSARIQLPVAPVRGQVVLTECLPPFLNGCISTSDCYLLQKQHGEVLIGSTTENEAFDVSVTQPFLSQLCQGAQRAVPALGQVSVKRVWPGCDPALRMNFRFWAK